MIQQWPSKEALDNIYSCSLSLDGGGKELVEDVLAHFSDCVMVEIGVFLGASSERWLDSKEDLKVYGVDLFGLGWDKIIERYQTENLPWMQKVLDQVSDPNLLRASLKENGSLLCTLKNLERHREKFFAIKGDFRDISADLSKLIDPDVIYIDADKSGDILVLCDQLFPNAIICGDDWTWGAEQGYPIRTAVINFCESKGLKYKAKNATWLIEKNLPE